MRLIEEGLRANSKFDTAVLFLDSSLVKRNLSSIVSQAPSYSI
jgi:hypothetical protein